MNSATDGFDMSHRDGDVSLELSPLIKVGSGVLGAHLAVLTLLVWMSFNQTQVPALPIVVPMTAQVLDASKPSVALAPPPPALSRPQVKPSVSKAEKPMPTPPVEAAPVNPVSPTTAQDARAQESSPKVAAAPVLAAPVFTAPKVDASFKGNPLPTYPTMSRRLGEQGAVVLRIKITPNGAASEVQVLQSSGYTRLDRSAIDAIQQWKFIPASRDGQAVAAWYEWRWTFQLN
jgi:protein TonB